MFVSDRSSAGYCFDCGHIQNRAPNRFEAGEREFSEFMEHVNGDDHACDGSKDDGEKNKGDEEFAHEIELRGSDNGQEIPEPNAATVTGGWVRDGFYGA